MSIDWEDPTAEAVDGFTVADVRQFATDSVVQARCDACEALHFVEPDARLYRCDACGEHGTVTSPLIKLGII